MMIAVAEAIAKRPNSAGPRNLATSSPTRKLNTAFEAKANPTTIDQTPFARGGRAPAPDQWRWIG